MTLLEKAICKAISKHTLWSIDAVEYSYDTLKSWDKVIGSCEDAQLLNIDLGIFSYILFRKDKLEWVKYNIGADGRLGTCGTFRLSGFGQRKIK